MHTPTHTCHIRMHMYTNTHTHTSWCGNSPTKADRMCRGEGYILNIDFRTKGCNIKRPPVQKRVHKDQCQKKMKNEKINKMNQGISRKIRVVDSKFRTNGCHFDVDHQIPRGTSLSTLYTSYPPPPPETHLSYRYIYK